MKEKDNWNKIYSYFKKKNFAIIKTLTGIGVMGGFYFENNYVAQIRFNNEVITIEKGEVKLATKEEILNYIFGDEDGKFYY